VIQSLKIIFFFPSAIKRVILKDNNLEVECTEKAIKPLLQMMKKNSLLKQNQLLDMWATDNLNLSKHRFTLYAMILSMKNNERIYITRKIKLIADLARATSLTSIFSSANFLEREIWDFVGIFFIKHPDLRRLLSDYGFQGFPLRKDFPLTGFKEVRYDDTKTQIVYTPVKLTQAYRYFHFETPWTIDKQY